MRHVSMLVLLGLFLVPFIVLGGPYWIVKWYDVDYPGGFGRYILTEIFPNFEFSKDWGRGRIFYVPIVELFSCWRDDYVGFRAETTFFVEKEQMATFAVRADDGFKLYLDGRLLLSRWQKGANFASTNVSLKPGLHRMTLYYYEWRGNAEITFSTTAQVLSLDEAVAGLWRENLSLGEKIALLEAYLSELEKKLPALESKVETLESLCRSRYEEIHKRIQELEEQVSELRGSQDLLASDVEGLQFNLTRVEKRIGELEGKIEILEELSERERENFQKLRHQIRDLESRVSDLRAELFRDIGALKEAIPPLEQSVKMVEGKVAELEEGALAIRGWIRDLEEAFEAELEALSREVGALKNSIEELRGELAEPKTSWEVHWYEMLEPGVFGQEIGITSFPLNFSFDWSYGRVYERWDHVGFKAQTMIYIPFDSFYYFQVAANNGFSLYIDGEKVLEHWGEEGPGSQSIRCFLPAGWHKLELQYYEWEGQAWLSFHCR